MAQSTIHSDNHYTPCVYLKGFAQPNCSLAVYRKLVSRSQVPLWKDSSIKGVGYLSHLYTRVAAGHETDEFERWFDDEFEAPAAEPLEKAISGDRLTPGDWDCLIRFLAAQIVRTPAFYVQNLPRWRSIIPPILESTLQDAVRKHAAALATDGRFPRQQVADSLIPISVSKHIEPGCDFGQLRVATVVGRGIWLNSMKSILAGRAARVLHEHKWTIVEPPAGLNWFTSDDPVIRLNFYSNGKYDFAGGTGATGGEILFPLSPRHLMYTHIGHSPPRRGSALPQVQTELIRRFVAEHAHRYIYAHARDNGVPALRPRSVNEQEYRQEQDHWRTWHKDQLLAESKLLSCQSEA